jgi:hypothetical protein
MDDGKLNDLNHGHGVYFKDTQFGGDPQTRSNYVGRINSHIAPR